MGLTLSVEVPINMSNRDIPLCFETNALRQVLSERLLCQLPSKVNIILCHGRERLFTVLDLPAKVILSCDY